MSNVKAFVKKLFSKHLLVTNTVTCGALLTIGDLIVQSIEKRNKKTKKPRETSSFLANIDWERSGRMCLIGTVFGPVNHLFYKYLDKHFVGKSLKVVMKKMAVDQFVAAPIFTSLFIYSDCILEGKSTAITQEEWKEKFPVIFLGDCVFWPPVQFVNFYFFPPKYRVLYVASVTLVWNTYLSFVKHNVSFLLKFTINLSY
ncbi:hypothetical protein LOTGIDRAFT_112617 [Lottia gigantea]|uniref:Mpv17-like protein 2 n=1 Tax=Lottia gigantea TaxID=225164 RepID=V4CES4_LOTGI|nr:hypothetical protein LOTGIDRAFT_112617 [Lottia gigantea]ESP00470.1 hypothetical protein LOTGIDRAFT_112617 [Lottia gigantea]